MIDVEIRQVTVGSAKKDIWNQVFAAHHYLSASFNSASIMFLAINAPDGVLIGMTSALTMPSGTLKSAWREHRTVVLPDYQGLGLGLRLCEWQAEWHLLQGHRFYSRTTHPRIGEARNQSVLWRATGKSGKTRKSHWSHASGSADRAVRYAPDTTRTAYSHEYIGDTN